MNVIKRLAAALLLTAASCGGGTAGTSATGGEIVKLLQGTVIGASGSPISGAAVEILESGQTALTDEFGRFSLAGNLEATDATLVVSKHEQQAAVALTNLSRETSIVGVQVQLDSAASSSSQVELVVESIGGGECEGAWAEPDIITFAEGTPPLVVIDQLRPLPAAAECTVQVAVTENGKPSDGLGFQLVFVMPVWLAEPDTGNGGGLQRVVGQGQTNAVGTGALAFSLAGDDDTGMGFYVIEAPTGWPAGERVGVVINPLLYQEAR